MPTATAQKSEKAQTEHTFHSRHRGLRVPRVQQVMRTDQIGQQHQHVYFTDENGRDVTKRRYEFGPSGSLTIKSGVDVYPDGPDGQPQDAVTFLRNHPEMNRMFFEDGNEPGKPTPSDGEFMAQVARASAKLDVDRIVELLKTERETFARPALIEAADEARKIVLTERQALQSQPTPEPADPASGE